MTALIFLPIYAFAQTDNGNDNQTASYQIGEQPAATISDSGDAAQTSDTSNANSGPVRLARFSYVQGNVTWRASDSDNWSDAAENLPLRQSAQIWVSTGGRAEVQFDDGSLLRLGSGAIVTLQTLYSDVDGEFTEIQMNAGLATLRTRTNHSTYQIDTPFVSVKAAGPSNVRVGVDNSVEIAVHSGAVTIQGAQGNEEISSGDYVQLSNADASYQVEDIPGMDSWDIWNNARDAELADSESASHLPSNIALVAGDLDTYGTWHQDVTYGWVWCPRGVATSWRPYYQGHWVWVSPFGWTWVSSERWGWAPYHYGTWIHLAYGWSWVPGPANQYWCPAVVNFSEYNGRIAWCPLGPREVQYPSLLKIGFRNGNWSVFFSIGGAAVYYPHDDHICTPKRWRNDEINHITVVNNITIINRRTTGTNVYLSNNRFVSVNARNMGVISADESGFGGKGQYRPENNSGSDFFANGREIGAPAKGTQPNAGPISVQPTNFSRTPSREFRTNAGPNASVLQRAVVRAPLPKNVAKFAPPIQQQQPTRFQPETMTPTAPTRARTTRTPVLNTGQTYQPANRGSVVQSTSSAQKPQGRYQPTNAGSTGTQPQISRGTTPGVQPATTTSPSRSRAYRNRDTSGLQTNPYSGSTGARPQSSSITRGSANRTSGQTFRQSGGQSSGSRQSAPQPRSDSSSRPDNGDRRGK
jgi:hypothetical protein